jgi:gamma-glutamyltranspeptidase/glutathione hydrolase
MENSTHTVHKKSSYVYLLFILGFIVFQYHTAFALEVTGRSGMVVTAHPIASEFGLEILKSGGNAIDAAVGAAIAIGVVEPNASGLGGGGAMLIYLHKLDSLTYINYYAKAQQLVATDFDPDMDKSRGIAVLIPGTVAGLYKALSQYGTLTWKDVLTRAIKKLEYGFKVDPIFYQLIIDTYEKLLLYPQTSNIYLKDRLPPPEGSLIKNPQLISTLKKLAEGGPEIFYEGEIADSIESVVIKNGGGLRKSDLKTYQATELQPIMGNYRNRHIVSAPPPQSGITIIETLHILEFKHISSMDHFTTSTETFHFMAEAMKRAYADRLAYLGDPSFVNVPVDVLTSKKYAKSRFNTIDMKQAVPKRLKSTKPGDVNSFQEDEHGSTTHISVVDQFGNAVSLTQTLNHFWGSGICVCGFLLNNAMTVFSTSNPVNLVQSNRTPRSTIAPTLVFEEDKLKLVIGSPGAGRIPSTIIEIITNIIDFNYNADQAIKAPRFCARKWADTLPVEDRFSEKFLDKLKSMGHPIEVMGEMDLFFGGVQLIVIDSEKNRMIGSSDPRRSGVALGY